MSNVQSIEGFDRDTLEIDEWKPNKNEVIHSLWGVATALEGGMLEYELDNEVKQCLSIAMVNLATQLKHSP